MGLFLNGYNSETSAATAGLLTAKGHVPMEWSDPCDGSGTFNLSGLVSNGEYSWDTNDSGKACLKLQHTVAAQATSYFAVPAYWSGDERKNLAGRTVRMRLYIPPHPNNITAIKLRLRSDTGTGLKEIQIWEKSFSNLTGWHDLVACESGWASAGAGYNPSLISFIGLSITRTSSGSSNPYVLLDAISIFDGRLTTPLYCLRADDNYLNHKELGDYAMSVGIPVSYCNPSTIIAAQKGILENTAGTGMTLEQNIALREAGHLHCNHSLTHSTSTHWASGGNHAAGLAELPIEKAWMDENGFTAASNIFVGVAGYWLQPCVDLGGWSGMYGRPNGASGVANQTRINTLWDEHTDIFATSYSNLSESQVQLARQVGTAQNEYADGQRGIMIDLWHWSAQSHPNEGYSEGTLNKDGVKAYLDSVAAHISAGRLRAVTLKELYQLIYDRIDSGHQGLMGAGRMVHSNPMISAGKLIKCGGVITN